MLCSIPIVILYLYIYPFQNLLVMKTQSTVSGFCYAHNRVCNAVSHRLSRCCLTIQITFDVQNYKFAQKMETIFIRHSSEHKASENGKKMQDTSPYALKRCNMAIWTRFDEHNLKFAEKMEI